MSDYLWDKTGEADEETRRLEELLGGFKFQPRPLELPELPARNFRAARTRSLLSWPRLAVAASLAAALLLGAWLMIAERRTTESGARQMAGTTEATGGEQDKYQPPVPVKDNGKATTHGEGKQQLIGDPGATPREVDAAKGPKPRRPDLAGDKRIRTPRVNRIEAARNRTPRATPGRPELGDKFTREEIAAAEKVMYALRVTSEKLAYARQQVQEAGRREPNR